MMSNSNPEDVTDSEEPEVWADAREWADRNGFSVIEGYPKDGVLSVKIGSYRYVLIDEYGGVELMELTHLCNSAGEVSFSDKQMSVTTERGETSHVSQNKFPTGGS